MKERNEKPPPANSVESSSKMTYEIFDPQVNKPLHQLTRSEARRHFELHLSSIDKRINELNNLTQKSGIEMDFTRSSVEKLDKWFPKEIRPHRKIPQEPDSKSFSICNDVAIYLGEILRKESNWIEWKINTFRKSDISYHRPVLTNFKGVNIKNYYVDFDLILCQYAFRVLQGNIESNQLILMLDFAIEKSK